MTVLDDPAAAGSAGDAERPVLALLAAPGTSGRAIPLLGLLGIHARVVSWHRRGALVPDGVLVTSVDSLRSLSTAPPAPVAVWVKHHDQIDRATEDGAALLLTANPDLVARGAVLVPPVAIEVDRWPAVAPLVRRRRREAAGLPAVHVLRVEGGVEPLGGERELAMASAAVVSGPATLLALALGTPVVTSPETVRRLGLRPGRDAEVAGGPDEAMERAEAIAHDDAWAAALSRHARRRAEDHLDLGRPAREVARRLGLAPSPAGAVARVDDRLAELATPAGSPTRARVADALAVLTADGGGSSA
ncbi:MAG TPA: glycosyltransferase [Acidimicrobiales bacterium]|nr:glycosyltransferase [Acidimicrobiales bacterium]